MRKLTLLVITIAFAAGFCRPVQAVEEPLIFQMADGSFFDVKSGVKAWSRDELLMALGLAAPDHSASSTGSAVDAPVRFSLKGAIVRGREMLQARVAAKEAENRKPKTVASYDVWVDVTLAVWNEKTDEISLVELKKNGARVELESAAIDLDVSVKKTNGVNSEYVFADEGENYVVAVEYPIFKEKWLTGKKRVFELHDVVYTPYSSKLHTAELVAWGSESLDAFIAAAYRDLNERGVRSRAFPERLMTEVIDPRLLKAILAIEHLSPLALEGDPARAMGSVFVTLAVNQDKAYAYSKSSAGASGIAQFMPSTYKLIARRQDLGLIADFETGTRDLTNIIKAETAYLDAELASMPAAVKELARSGRMDLAGAYLAAAYNGGGARVRVSIKAFGDKWAENNAAWVQAVREDHWRLDVVVASLKKKIAQETNAAKLKALKAELRREQAAHDRAYEKAVLFKSAGLKNETMAYVQKYQIAVSHLWPAPTPINATTAVAEVQPSAS